MPIADVTLVLKQNAHAPAGIAQDLADAMAKALGTQPGHLWLRLHTLDQSNYAENDSLLDSEALPVFITLLHARPLQGAPLLAEVEAVTNAVAACLGRPQETIHLEYAPPGMGRVAFGGKVVQ